MIKTITGDINRADLDKYVAWKKEYYGANFFTKEFMYSKVQQGLNNIIAGYKRRLSDPLYHLSSDKLNSDIHFRSLIYINLSSLADYIINYSIYANVINGNIDELHKGIYTYGRLYYLANLAEQSYFRASHSRSLLLSSAGNDQGMFQAYLRALPGRPTVGHLMLKSLVIGLYALIDDDPKRKADAVISLTKATQTKVLGKWEKAVVACIMAILHLDQAQFSESLQIVLALHARSFLTRGLLAHISLPAHGLYTFAYYAFEKAGLQPPAEPNHRYWDTEFWHLVKNSGQKREYSIDIQSVSPVLARWMDELPTRVELSELVSA